MIDPVVCLQLLPLFYLFSDLDWLLTFVGYLAPYEFPQKSSEGEDIDTFVVLALLEKFWRHIVWCSRILKRSFAQVRL